MIHMLGFSPEQTAAVGMALHKTAEQALDRARKALSADSLTLAETKERVDMDLREITAAASALDQVWPEVAGVLAGEATTLRAEFARVERQMERNEREVNAWNERAEVERAAAQAAH